MSAPKDFWNAPKYQAAKSASKTDAHARALDTDGFLRDVALIDDMQAIAKVCPMCLHVAVVPLTKKQLAKQPDETTHVCHPAIGGCNYGFGPQSTGDAK